MKRPEKPENQWFSERRSRWLLREDFLASLREPLSSSENAFWPSEQRHSGLLREELLLEDLASLRRSHRLLWEDLLTFWNKTIRYLRVDSIIPWKKERGFVGFSEKTRGLLSSGRLRENLQIYERRSNAENTSWSSVEQSSFQYLKKKKEETFWPPWEVCVGFSEEAPGFISSRLLK